MCLVTRGTSGRSKKAVTHIEAVSNGKQRSMRGPDRQALILRVFAQLETWPRTEWAVDEIVIEQL